MNNGTKYIIIIVGIILFLSSVFIVLRKKHIYNRPVWLGIQVVTVDKKVANNFNLHCRRGLLVRRIIDGSPADKAGLEQGDVIRRIGNTRITSTLQLENIINKIIPEQKKRIVIARGRVKKTLYAKLETRPFIIANSNTQLVHGIVPTSAPPVNKPYPYFYFGEEREGAEEE